MPACFITVSCAAVLVTATLAGCATSAKPPPLTMSQARAMFEGRGVQQGQTLGNLAVYTLDGRPTTLLREQGGRPMLIVTASLTCDIANRRQPELDQLAADFGRSLAVVVLYTIEAHPTVDPCPYTGEEWVTPATRRDGLLHRQPTSLEQRLDLARRYHRRRHVAVPVVVDAIENDAWTALGAGPNLAVLLNSRGVVHLKQGWFAAGPMRDAVAQVLRHDSP